MFFCTLVWPSIDLPWVTFQGHTFFDRLCMTTQEPDFVHDEWYNFWYDTGTLAGPPGRSSNLGQMRVIPNSTKIFLKNKLGPILYNWTLILSVWYNMRSFLRVCKHRILNWNPYCWYGYSLEVNCKLFPMARPLLLLHYTSSIRQMQKCSHHRSRV